MLKMTSLRYDSTATIENVLEALIEYASTITTKIVPKTSEELVSIIMPISPNGSIIIENKSSTPVEHVPTSTTENMPKLLLNHGKSSATVSEDRQISQMKNISTAIKDKSTSLNRVTTTKLKNMSRITLSQISNISHIKTKALPSKSTSTITRYSPSTTLTATASTYLGHGISTYDNTIEVASNVSTESIRYLNNASSKTIEIYTNNNQTTANPLKGESDTDDSNSSYWIQIGVGIGASLLLLICLLCLFFAFWKYKRGKSQSTGHKYPSAINMPRPTYRSDPRKVSNLNSSILEVNENVEEKRTSLVNASETQPVNISEMMNGRKSSLANNPEIKLAKISETMKEGKSPITNTSEIKLAKIKQKMKKERKSSLVSNPEITLANVFDKIKERKTSIAITPETRQKLSRKSSYIKCPVSSDRLGTHTYEFVIPAKNKFKRKF